MKAKVVEYTAMIQVKEMKKIESFIRIVAKLICKLREELEDIRETDYAFRLVLRFGEVKIESNGWIYVKANALENLNGVVKLVMEAIENE
ncbi:MAG: hypothetical protein GXO68_05675 [Crenarchaeota archaeon]|nr:hypothetical protein [Thermoproteota archaeon]